MESEEKTAISALRQHYNAILELQKDGLGLSDDLKTEVAATGHMLAAYDVFVDPAPWQNTTGVGKKKNRLIEEAQQRGVSIQQVLQHYGIKTRQKMAWCPVHDDKTPSLSFNNEKAVWNCFGCGEKGNLLTLIDKLNELTKIGKGKRNSN